MSRRSATVWNYDKYDLMGDAESPYYLICFKQPPVINEDPITFATGDILHIGDTLAYLGGRKTSAGFEYLHPVSPFLFRYLGCYCDDKQQYVLWETGIEGNDEYYAIYYAHSVFESNGIVNSLLFTNRAGSGRVIEAEIFHAVHETIPQNLYPKNS